MTQNIKITEIEIAGFKSVALEHPLKLTIKDVNIFLGANGAGKSNIISFLRLVSYMMSGALQKFVAKAGSNQVLFHNGIKETPRIMGKLTMQNVEDTDSYQFVLSPASEDRVIITEEKIAWKRDGKESPYREVVESDYKESGLLNSRSQTAKTVRNLLSRCKTYQFHDSSIGGPLRQSSLINAAQYLQSEGNNLGSFLYFLKDIYPESYRRIVENVRIVMPQFGDFYLEPVNNYVTLNWIDSSGSDNVFTVDQFSDGTIRFIALATLLLQPSKTMPSVIVIDEPELGLHPYAIDQLSAMIKDASLHSQLIIATQSPLLVDRFPADDVTVLDQDTSRHYTTAHHLLTEELKDWLEEYTISELWQKNIIGGLPL